jgi:hypothetical protein
MAHGVDSTKLPSRPSHEGVERGTSNPIEEGKTDQQKIDNVALRGAKRAENRIIGNDQRIPGSTIFTK